MASDLVEAGNTSVSCAQPKRDSYNVFISHAGEDKGTIAKPLRKALREEGITAFVDECDMEPGTEAVAAMMAAMETAQVAVIVLSPEFVAKKWTMKELMFFLKRREECLNEYRKPPVIIPFFYRLSIDELYGEPRFDRVDRNGNSLYVKSRFYERRDAGEPEANEDNIKAALRAVHGFQGIRNDVDATNDSINLMYDRREILLNELRGSVCRALCGMMPANAPTQLRATNEAEKDSFKPHFDASPNDVSNLVFDFDGSDKDASKRTIESQVFEALLDMSESKPRRICLVGRAGVGKTSILEGIRDLKSVKQRFSDGVYFLSMGSDATRAGLRDNLIRAVHVSGGNEKAKIMRRKNDIGDVFEEFRYWFTGRQCLFVVDDVWETTEVSSGIISHLLTLQKFGQDSKVLMSTRSRHIASRADKVFRIDERTVKGNVSRSILYQYSGLKPALPRNEHLEDNKAVDSVLNRCHGLPLFLAVAGRAVKALAILPNHDGCLAYQWYSDDLDTSMGDLVDSNIDSEKGLSARLMISVGLLEKRREKLGFETKLTVAEMHRRLRVFRKQARISMDVLKHVWELTNKKEATIVTKELEQVGLADIAYANRNRKSVLCLHLHDTVYDFAVYESQNCKEEKEGHNALISGYGSQVNRIHQGCREWWSTRIEEDNYIHANLCRHLFESGNGLELAQLLLSPQWAERQLKVNEMMTLQADFSLGIQAIEKGIGRESKWSHNELAEALQLIREALCLSSEYVAPNITELWFQLHGRLHGFREDNGPIREYVEWIERDASRQPPLMLSVSRHLREPGSPHTRSIYVGGPVNCMVLSPDRSRVICGLVDGRISVVNVVRHEVVRTWEAHTLEITSIACEKFGSRIVTGSVDKMAKMWEVESGECVAIFKGHEASVTCVAMTHDGKLAASGCMDGTFQVWNTDNAQAAFKQTTNFQVSDMELRRPALKNCWAEFKMAVNRILKGVEFVAFLASGSRVLTGGRSLQLWNAETGAEVNITCGVLSTNILLLYALSHLNLRSRLYCDSEICKLMNESSAHLSLTRTLHSSFPDELSVLSFYDFILDDVISSGNVVVPEKESQLLKEYQNTLRHDQPGTFTVGLVSIPRYVQFFNRCAALSADSSRIVYNDDQRNVMVYDVNSKMNCCRQETGHTRQITGVVFLNDGDLTASSSYDGTVRVSTVRVSTVGYSKTNKPHIVHRIRNLNFDSFSPEGNYVIYFRGDKTLRICSSKQREPILLEVGRYIVSAAMTPDVRYVVVVRNVSWDGNEQPGNSGLPENEVWHHPYLLVWDLEKQCSPKEFPFPFSEMALMDDIPVAVTPNGHFAVTGSKYRGNLLLHDLRSNTGRGSIIRLHLKEDDDFKTRAERLLFSDDGSRIISVYENGVIAVWNVEMKKVIRKVETIYGSSYLKSAPRKHILVLSEESLSWNKQTKYIRRRDNKFVFGPIPDAHVLATCEQAISRHQWSPEGTEVYARLVGEEVVILKLLV